jgi:hypothetical protein
MSKVSKNVIISVILIVVMSAAFYFIKVDTSTPDEIGIQTFISEVKK